MKFISSVFLVASLILFNVEAYVIPKIWIPDQGLSWNDVLGDRNFDVKKENADVIVVDYETSAEKINEYHSYGKKVICYFSGGTLESWRSDKDDYYAVDGLVRNVYGRWEKERWLDFRKSGLKPLIKKRMQIAIDNNCDALEVDNLDAYQSRDVKNVWSDPIDEEDTVEFAKWLAQTAHELGISIGLKNIPGLIQYLIEDFDFALNESCDKYVNECSMYKEFVASGKAVFGMTYGDFDELLPNLCKELNGVGISLIVKPTQALTQDGIVFDGKKYCGSDFDTGYTQTKSSSTSSSGKVVSSSAALEQAIREAVKEQGTTSADGVKKVIVVVKTVKKN